MNDLDSALPDYERYRQALARVGQSNKRIVFDALAATDISHILVDFDGEGDQGQIQNVTAYGGLRAIDLPATTVTIQHLSWGNTKATVAAQTLREAIESLCYDYLEETHGGWENNDGAYGEFRLDVTARTVELEFNGRYTDVFTETHSF